MNNNLNDEIEKLKKLLTEVKDDNLRISEDLE